MNEDLLGGLGHSDKRFTVGPTSTRRFVLGTYVRSFVLINVRRQGRKSHTGLKYYTTIKYRFSYRVLHDILGLFKRHKVLSI